MGHQHFVAMGCAGSMMHGLYGLVDHLDIVLPLIEGRYFFVDPEEGVYGYLGGTNGVFYRKDHVIRDFGELTEEGKVDGPVGHHCGAVAFRAGQEFAGDIRHHAGDAYGISQDSRQVVAELKMRKQFNQNLRAGTLTHLLVDVVTCFIRKRA